MAMIENESLAEENSTNTSTETVDSTTPESNPDQLISFEIPSNPVEKSLSYFSPFEFDYSTQIDSNLLDLNLFNRLMDTNNLLLTDFSNTTKENFFYCSYCSLATDTTLITLECSLHKICNQCFTFSSASSSRKNSDTGCKLIKPIEASNSLESSSVSSSDENHLEDRFSRSTSLKCKLCVIETLSTSPKKTLIYFLNCTRTLSSMF